MSFWGNSSLAQVPRQQAPSFPLFPKPIEPIPLPEKVPEIPLPLPAPITPPQEKRPDIPGSIIIKSFEFQGSTVFSNEELATVTAPFTNKPITFAQLLQVETAIAKLYTSKGYINSGAFIPSGQVFSPDGAVVKIQIVEGGVEEIKVKVDGRLHSDYVRSRLALATTKPLNQNRLLEALQLLQLNPLIKTISADLSAGTRPELSVLSVRVQEADTFNVEIFANNGRVKSIGSFERGIRFNQANLFGIGDGLRVEYTNTDGSNGVSADYTMPVNPRNGSIQFSARFNNTNVVESPFDRLDITGDSRYFDLTFRQPVMQNPRQELALGITASRAESDTTLLGVGFPLSPGANDEGETRISALRFFQEWIQRGSQDVFSLRSQFSLGLDAFDGTKNDQPPDSRFLEWQGQGQYVRLLAPDTLLVMRSSVQLSSDPLLSLEQFSLGGLDNVRGYEQNLLLTDNGVFASAEIRVPILRVAKVNGVLQIVPFVDFGIGWNNEDNQIPTPDSNTLVSTGLGLQWQMGDDFNARLDWGIPLNKFEVGGNDVSGQETYFTVNYSFF